MPDTKPRCVDDEDDDAHESAKRAKDEKDEEHMMDVKQGGDELKESVHQEEQVVPLPPLLPQALPQPPALPPQSQAPRDRAAHLVRLNTEAWIRSHADTDAKKKVNRRWQKSAIKTHEVFKDLCDQVPEGQHKHRWTCRQCQTASGTDDDFLLMHAVRHHADSEEWISAVETMVENGGMSTRVARKAMAEHRITEKAKVPLTLREELDRANALLLETSNALRKQTERVNELERRMEEMKKKNV